jgi:hypothetical protein
LAGFAATFAGVLVAATLLAAGFAVFVPAGLEELAAFAAAGELDFADVFVGGVLAGEGLAAAAFAVAGLVTLGACFAASPEDGTGAVVDASVIGGNVGGAGIASGPPGTSTPFLSVSAG